MTETWSVAQLLERIGEALTTAVPESVWVRGEVSGLNRTSRGAAFFRLVDADSDIHVVEVAARGMTMTSIDSMLESAGVGSLRSGIAIRMRGQLGLNTRMSRVQLTLIEVDPAFTAGRLALDRAEVIRRLTADGSLDANRKHPLPLVPLRIGLVTSRGSAAHADFLHQLASSGYRFAVRTASSSMQGDLAVEGLVRSLDRVSGESVDMVALVRGGGSKLDLAAFDTEEVGRAIARVPVPLITGIGHETDRSVADEAAAVAVKTPSAAGEWIVSRVSEFHDRIDRAREAIRQKATEAHRRSVSELAAHALQVGGARTALARQGDVLDSLGVAIGDGARAGLRREHLRLDSISEVLTAVGLESTLNRGFALVQRADGSAVTRSQMLAPGERVTVRFADGTVEMTVEGGPDE
jgi:exodeoxyribonuclease VII large subunit